jgi:xanthine dehydrogenase YagR molybdenum-binding subunit
MGFAGKHATPTENHGVGGAIPPLGTTISITIANAIYNATGVRVRDYPITLDKLLDRLPDVG